MPGESQSKKLRNQVQSIHILCVHLKLAMTHKFAILNNIQNYFYGTKYYQPQQIRREVVKGRNIC